MLTADIFFNILYFLRGLHKLSCVDKLREFDVSQVVLLYRVRLLLRARCHLSSGFSDNFHLPKVLKQVAEATTLNNCQVLPKDLGLGSVLNLTVYGQIVRPVHDKVSTIEKEHDLKPSHLHHSNFNETGQMKGKYPVGMRINYIPERKSSGNSIK